MSETKAAFAERTIRSLKNILYRYMEDNGDKYIHKLTQFVTTLSSRRNCSIDLIPKNVKNSDFLSILYSKPLREFRKPKFKVGDRVRISKYNLPFRKGYRPQCTEEVFEIVAISSKKPPTYTMNMNKMKLSAVNFIRKSWSKLFNNGIAYNRVGFKCICATFSRQYIELFSSFLPEQPNLDGQREVAFSEISYPSLYQMLRRENLSFLTRNFQSCQSFIIWNLVFTLPLRILLKLWTLSFRKDTILAKTVSQLKCIEERKKLRFTLQMKDPVLHSLVRIWDTFSEFMLVMNLE